MCKFCEEYEFTKKLNSCSDDLITTSVYMAQHVFINGKPKALSIPDAFSKVGFPLKFCPECGKNLLED